MDLVPNPMLGAEMARQEINILSITDDYVLYEFSYINDETKMKKWAKRLAPLKSNVGATYNSLIKLVESERRAMGQ